MSTAARLYPLKTEQADAAEPAVNAWVTASAGTGKTQVLSARVLRLLLQGVPPHAILCLTFTKLAAAEMQNRVFERLARWSRCSDAELADDLASLRAPGDDFTLARARRLFAHVLDAPGGLAVQTIHAFAQSLIASFPIEAGVAPGFATLDDRNAAVLRRRLLTEAIEAAEDDDGFLADLAAISISGGEQRLAAVAARLTGYDEALAGLRLDGIPPMLRRGFGLATASDGPTALAEAMARFNAAGVERLALAWEGAGNTTALKSAGLARQWLAQRGEAFGALKTMLLTKDQPRVAKSAVPAAADKADPSLRPLFETLADAVVAIVDEQRLHAAVDHAARHLRVGKRLAADWSRAKARLGVIDYDDMIAAAQRLLLAPGAAEWVRYKLDQRIDHVLVDEAQDTNGRQWRIVEALTREFFDGAGARDDQRTLFVVGDYKQAIFSFQGSDPQVYRDQREVFEQLASDGRQRWERIPLATNFRSVPAVLEVVDAVVEVLGETTFDTEGVKRHTAHRKGAGLVTLWPPVGADALDSDAEDADYAGAADPADDTTGDASDNGETARPARSEIILAHRIAATVAGWFDPAAPLILPARGVPVKPQDILVLVRRRSAFSAALVSALHVAQVPVAGVDRLKLTDPLAVADLLALARFALQPGDDLTLAALLVSPFLNFSHDALLALAHGRDGTLWERLRADGSADGRRAAKWLGDVLALADFTAPYEFFERILSGELAGRRKLLARLGAEARDAIDAVLDQALAFETANPPSLQGFLAWVEADDIEIKRDPDAPLDAIRLMTVHGAKGLQAPVVILADATRGQNKHNDGPVLMTFDNRFELPLFLRQRGKLTGPVRKIIDQQEADAAREDCRLLYVALTRAEDMLFIGGALGRNKTDPPEESWYMAVSAALEGLGAEAVDVDTWQGTTLVYRSGSDARLAPRETRLDPDSALQPPDWITARAPEEARPPRPLSPSALAADDVAAPPMGAAAQAAARRGAALHALFERLPELADKRRRDVALAWCAANVPELDGTALVDAALSIMHDPRFAGVFAPDALSEAPIAAQVGEIVIAGKVDRLLVTPDIVTVIDFKTGRRVPAGAEAAEPYHLRQMAAYAAALAVIFPGRAIRAALLFTEGPALIELPPALLALHHPQGEVSLNPGGATPILPD